MNTTPSKQLHKILITTDLFSTDTNGVATSVRNLQEELTGKGYDVRILTLSDRMRSHRDGSVYYIRSLPLGIVYPHVRVPASFRHRLIRELIDWKPDIIHSQCEFFSFQYALRISKLTGAPIVHTYHTLYEQYVPYLFHSAWLGEHVVRTGSRRRLKRVSRVIAPTRKVEKALHSYGLRNSICVVPSGISLEQHQQRLSPQERQERRRALGIGDGQLVLIYLGRLGLEKNLTELLELFASAVRRGEDVVFLMVGDGPAREELEKLVRSLGVEERVIFTGMVPSSQVQEYYQLGDLFVSASTSETQGLTYVEAAANGLPLLCRQDPCLTDVIHPGENGYEYTSNAEFLDCLHSILNDPAWRRSAGRRSEELASAFDKHSFGQAIEAVYQSVCTQSQQPGAAGESERERERVY